MNPQLKTHIALYLGEKSKNPHTKKLDQFICCLTGEPYSHVELVYDYSPITNVGLTWSSSSRDGGVRPTRIDFSSNRWEIYEIPTMYTEDEIVTWFNSRSGVKYDWFGSIGVVLPFVRQEPSRYFCSEIVGMCLGVPNAHKLSPGRLLHYYSATAKRVF